MPKHISLLSLLALAFVFICQKAHAQDTLTDYDGNRYPFITIGTQTWMAENLRSTHDASGQAIKRVCYQYLEANCDTFGGLYSWIDLKIDEDSKQPQGICPDGWHIPSDNDWDVFMDALGGADSAAIKLNYGPYRGFNVQCGGNFHHRLQNFNYLDKIAYYWSATSFSPTAAWMRMIGKQNLNANRSTVPKVYCLSVRCVKND